MSVDTVSREPVTQHVMYREWKEKSAWRGPQVVNLPRLDIINGELLAQLGPTALNIAEGNLSAHERWPLQHFVY